MIQLNRPDCLWKLSRDLLYLFVYHPTADFTMPLDDLLAVYAECFGRKFVPAVYAAKKFEQLMGGKHMLKVMKVGKINRIDRTKHSCMNTQSCKDLLLGILSMLLFCSLTPAAIAKRFGHMQQRTTDEGCCMVAETFGL